MTKKLNISRRHFLNCVALSVAAGSSFVYGAIDAADRAVNEQIADA